MATTETEVPETGVNHVDSKETLTSVTEHENFSVPEGHEVTVVQHSTNNTEAVVTISTDEVVVSPGRLVSLARGDSVEAKSHHNCAKLELDGGVEGVAVPASPPADASATVAKETDSSAPQSPKGETETNNAEGEAVRASHPTECLVDQTAALISAEESVPEQTATKDSLIVPNQPVVLPMVNRPKRPPPPAQVPSQIQPEVSDAVQSTPPTKAVGASEHSQKSKSLTRLRTFGSSMRTTFKKMKTNLRIRKKEHGQKQTVGGAKDAANLPIHGGSVHDENSLCSSMDLCQSHPASATNTPLIARREERVNQAMPDLMVAMQDDHGAAGVSPTQKDRDRTDHDGVATRRPGSFWAGLSLDRRKPEQVRRHVPLEIRRTQTLRTTDYPARLRDRIRRCHVDSVAESTEPVGYKRQTLTTAVSERSDKINWPPKVFSFRRNRPAKTVYSTGQESSLERAKTRQPTSPRITSEIEPKLEGHVFVEPPVVVYKEEPQRVSPPCLPTEESASGQGLTSLASNKRVTLLQQMSKGLHADVKPVFRLVMHSEKAVGQAVPLPYFSETLPKKDKWVQKGANLGLHGGLTEVHPFLAAWTAVHEKEGASHESDEEGGKAEKETAVTCLQHYLTSCLKLYSVDLQGQFAPFHYPLNESNVKRWQQSVIIDDCIEVRILREPQWNTEYMELVNLHEGNVAQRTLFYANRPIDSLLTAWLDCRKTVRPTTSKSTRRETPVYHPVQVIAQLNQVLTVDGEETPLLGWCMRLAVLLTYNYIKTQLQLLNHDVLLNTDAKHIILFISTTNCLVAFTRQEKYQTEVPAEKPTTEEAEEKTQPPTTSTEEGKSGEQTEAEEAPPGSSPEDKPAPETEQPDEHKTDSELGTLLKSTKCDECTTSEEAIDKALCEIRKLVTGQLSPRSLAVPFMRAVVPPDWMAMTLARVCIAKD